MGWIGQAREDGCMDGWEDGWMDGWMNGWMEGKEGKEKLGVAGVEAWVGGG